MASVALVLSGCASSEVSPNGQSKTPHTTPPAAIEERPKVMGTPVKTKIPRSKTLLSDDPRYIRVNKTLKALDYTSAGYLWSVNYSDGTNNPLSVGANFDDERTFQILSNRMKSFYGPENCNELDTEQDVRVTCRKDKLEIVADNEDGNTSEVHLRVTDIAASANSHPKFERKLTKSPSVKDQTTTYNVASSEISDLCSWDEGSDGSYEFKDIPCRTHNVMHNSLQTKMSVTVTDILGEKHELSLESTAIDPKVIDNIIEGLLGSP